MSWSGWDESRYIWGEFKILLLKLSLIPDALKMLDVGVLLFK